MSIPFGIPTNAPNLPPGEDAMVAKAQPMSEKNEGRADLLPCPFCGAWGAELMVFCDPEEGADNSGPSRRVQCGGCNIEAPFYDSEAEAIAAWNTRASSRGDPVAWRVRHESDDHWTALTFDDPRYAPDGSRVPAVEATPLYASPTEAVVTDDE